MEVLVIWILLNECLMSATCHSSTLCFQQRPKVDDSKICEQESDKLSCNEDEVIKINNVRYARNDNSGKGTCDHCSGKFTTADWQISLTSFKSKIYQYCSKQNKCLLNDVAKPSTTESDKEYLWQAIITYDCINTGLFKDICSSWEKTLKYESLYITYNATEAVLGYCSCIIKGAAIAFIVDYRPYHICSDTTFIVDGKLLTTCSQGGHPSIFNEPISYSRDGINLTVLFSKSPPQMFWLRITAFAHVHCYAERQVTRSTATILTNSEATLTTTTTTSRNQQTEIFISGSANTVMTTEKRLSQKDDIDGSEIPVLAIVVGIVCLTALVVAGILTYIFCKRRACRLAQKKHKRNGFNAVHFKAEKTGKPTISIIMNDVLYQDAEDITNSNSAFNNQETTAYSDYLEPVQAIADGSKANDNIENTNTALYENIANDNEKQCSMKLATKENECKCKCKYTQVIKDRKNNGVYNSVTEIDDYSHIRGFKNNSVPKCTDDYAHTKIRQESKSSQELDIYSHFNKEDISNSGDCQSVQENNENDEINEYDHLENYSNA